MPWRRRTADELATTAICDRWRETCEGVAGRQITNGAGVPVTLVPRCYRVEVGAGDVVLHVRLLAGQLPDDLRAETRRLAEGMGVATVRVTPTRPGYVRVALLLRDPLAATHEATSGPLRSALDPLPLGIGEDGTQLSMDLGASAHLIVQGTTGSGKSVFTYGLLAQLAAAPDVLVTGSDVSGLLLAPWADHPRHAGHQVLGTGDPQAHVALLEQRVAHMDKAIAAIPRGRDSVQLGPDCPITLVIVEEFAGLLRLLDSTDKRLGIRARTALARLQAEGRKAGIRVMLIVQRADAAIIGAYERGQASHRISFRVDTRAAVDMLHPGVEAEIADEHATAPAGVALLTAPGRPLLRFRAPHLDYAAYCQRVTRS